MQPLKCPECTTTLDLWKHTAYSKAAYFWLCCGCKFSRSLTIAEQVTLRLTRRLNEN